MEQTCGNRVRELRKSLDLTQDKFGARLGVGRAAISALEKGVSSLTDQMAKLICQTYHVSEAWLLNGEGEMYSTVPDAFLDELFQKYDCSETARWIIMEFLKLPPDAQDAFYKFVLAFARDAAKPVKDQHTNPPDQPNVVQNRQASMGPQDTENPQDATDLGPSSSSEIDRKVADYRRRLELEERQEDTSGASSQGSATA